MPGQRGDPAQQRLEVVGLLLVLDDAGQLHGEGVGEVDHRPGGQARPRAGPAQHRGDGESEHRHRDQLDDREQPRPDVEGASPGPETRLGELAEPASQRGARGRVDERGRDRQRRLGEAEQGLAGGDREGLPAGAQAARHTRDEPDPDQRRHETPQQRGCGDDGGGDDDRCECGAALLSSRSEARNSTRWTSLVSRPSGAGAEPGRSRAVRTRRWSAVIRSTARIPPRPNTTMPDSTATVVSAARGTRESPGAAVSATWAAATDAATVSAADAATAAQLPRPYSPTACRRRSCERGRAMRRSAAAVGGGTWHRAGAATGVLGAAIPDTSSVSVSVARTRIPSVPTATTWSAQVASSARVVV